jgi:thymidylate synthase (FAD)
VDSEPEFYTPEVWRKRADNVKQGSSDEPATYGHFEWTGPNKKGQQVVICETFDKIAKRYSEAAVQLYGNLLLAEVCPEQARMVLPQSMMTEWWWSGSIAAFARVCKLRLDPHTQKETRDVAQMMSDKLEKLFPVSWKALMEIKEGKE